MANTVIAVRSSGTAAATPSLGVIANGEIALNFADGIIYYKTSSNTLGSIRTTQPAGLTTEVQYNDAGSFGANANFTFNKTIATLNVKNINVSTNLTTVNLTATSITTGSGVGGIIAGANVIYSNIFVANSTTTSTSNSTGAIISNGGIGVKGNVYADAIYDGGVEVIVFAQAAFNQANTDYTTISTTAGVYGNAAFHPVVTLTANGRVSSITNTAIAISADAVTSGTLLVARGGTGVTTSTGTGAVVLNTSPTLVNVSVSSVNVTNTTASTSKTTGALTVAGGVGVAGNVSTLGINVDNRIDWAGTGFAQPSFTTRSAGQKITLYPAITGSLVDYSIGIDGGVLWSTVPAATTSYQFKWYGGESEIASLRGDGLFTTISANITSTTASTSNTTGALKVAGGIGVKGNVSANGIIFDDGTRQTTAASGGASIGDVLALSIALG